MSHSRRDFIRKATIAMPQVNLADQSVKVVASADTGRDTTTTNNMRNWMECVRDKKKTNTPAEAGYAHAIACIMTNAAARTGTKVTFDEKSQEVLAGGKVFKY